MASTKSSFLDKVLGRIGRLDPEGLQTVVQRLARERSFLETLFNTIEDGVLVADEQGRNRAALGVQADSSGFFVYDQKEQVRGVLGQTKGGSRILLLDPSGKSIFAKP